MSMQETVLTDQQAQEARECIELMRQAVNSVPSYVEVNAMKAWLENHPEEQNAA